MKKIFFALALLLPVLAVAQDKIIFGINAGATLSDVRGSEYADDLKYGFNYLLGVSAEIPLSEKVSFSANLNYEKKSPTLKIHFRGPDGPIPTPDPAFSTGSARITTTLSYISVPLTLKFYLGGQKKFYILGGAFAAFKVGETYRVDGNKDDTADNDGYKTMDFGLTAGFGTKLKLTETQNLNIELRDNLGFANISNNNYAVSDEIRTNSINLIANWQFSL